MSNLIANTELELETVNHLLDKQLPSYRKAFSDRTAWVMACCSELAYIRFNPLFSKEQQKDYFLEHVAKLIGEKKQAALVELINIISYDHNEERERLCNELSLLRMELIETYDCKGTQAILLSYGDYIVLAFRGTEPKSIRDIRSDADGVLIDCPVTKGLVHKGFNDAYELVADDIQKKLNEEAYADKILFITGHSLGGALATVAAKRLDHKAGIGACYTYGSPRVGNKEWICGLKTPIYRIVNAADAVTMLPPGGIVVGVLGSIVQFIPSVGALLKKALVSKFGGYMHAGNMRYLENAEPGQFEKVELLYSVSLPYRIKGLIYNQLSWKNVLSDHSITTYRKKLTAVAKQRNPKE